MRLLPRVSAVVGVSLLIASVACFPAQPPAPGREGRDASRLAIGKRWKVEPPSAPLTAPSVPGAPVVAIGKRWSVETPV